MKLLRTPARTFLPVFALAAVALPVGCSTTTNDAGPPISAQAYFNFQPGYCFEYAAGDAGSATRGLLLATVASPPGEIMITTLKRGQTEQIEYLTFDAGYTFLNGRDLYPVATSDAGIDSRSFDTPLTYLVAPLSENMPDLTSGSTYMGTSTGFENFSVGLLDHDTWNGVGADAGGSESFYLQFSAQDDGGGGPTQNKRMLPGVGFVQLYATDDLGNYVFFSLVDIKGDGGPYMGLCGD